MSRVDVHSPVSPLEHYGLLPVLHCYGSVRLGIFLSLLSHQRDDSQQTRPTLKLFAKIQSYEFKHSVFVTLK